ncbi:MAG: hypothetical protein R3E39_32235 [Anaerolineae bacterium]
MARPKVEFWLNTNKPDEQWLLEQIPILKANNQFSRFVRDGLTFCIQLQELKLDVASVYHLLVDLRNGNTDRLFALFPHVRTMFEQGRVNGWTGVETPPRVPFGTLQLPQAAATEAELDLEAIGEDFLDFIS